MSNPYADAISDVKRQMRRLQTEMNEMREVLQNLQILARRYESNTPKPTYIRASIDGVAHFVEQDQDLTSREIVRLVLDYADRPLSPPEIIDWANAMLDENLNRNTLYWALNRELDEGVIVKEGDSYRLAGDDQQSLRISFSPNGEGATEEQPA